MHGGLVSAHASRWRRGDADLFVKELKDNERDVLKRLVPLGLEHVVHVVYPELLDRGIMVADFVPGGPITGKRLEPGLVRDYATIQNCVTSDSGRESHRAFYRDSLVHWWDGGRASLDRLTAEQGWPILDGWRGVAEGLDREREAVIEEFGRMPFAQVHNDFREENILAGPPQVIADWGSYYRGQPFLSDLAPFCLGHPETLSTFAEHSDICRAEGAARIRRWLFVCACARFWGDIFYLSELAAGRDPEAWLAYEYETYRLLPQAQEETTRGD
jgi:hypothetical protein